jgi:hypothetical protein
MGIKNKSLAFYIKPSLNKEGFMQAQEMNFKQAPHLQRDTEISPFIKI